MRKGTTLERHQKWLNLIEMHRGKLQEKITEAYERMANKESGLIIDVEIYEDGTVDTVGIMTQSTQSGESWSGKSYVVATIHGWYLDGHDIVEDMKFVDDGKYWNLYEQAEDKEYYTATEWIYEHYPEFVKDCEKNYIEWVVSEFDADQLIDRAIEDLKQYIDCEKAVVSEFDADQQYE